MSEAWIQTYTGRQWMPLNPNGADVCVEDIAHALSNVCRFTGHVREFYSVAQHSVYVAEVLETLGLSAAVVFQGLLHDAAEAYLCDMARPVKRSVVGYREIETENLRVIFVALGVPWPMAGAVKVVDERMLMTEARDLMGPKPEPWSLDADPYPFVVEPVPPKVAEESWLVSYHELRSRWDVERRNG